MTLDTTGYRRLDAFIALPRNSKSHDLGIIFQSITRFGFIEPVVVNSVTSHILSGHGRVETLFLLRSEGNPPPHGIRLDTDGEWMAPIHLVTLPASEEEAAALALNQTTLLGGWHQDQLADTLARLAKETDGLLGTGFDMGDLHDLSFRLDPPPSLLDPTESPEDAAARPLRYGVTALCNSAEDESALAALLANRPDTHAVTRLSAPKHS